MHVDAAATVVIYSLEAKLSPPVQRVGTKPTLPINDSWHLSSGPGVTAVLLREAAKGLTDTKPNAVMDSGVENINASVNELIESGIINRVLAQVDVIYSNSMIESWWRAIKHQWLFLHSLDTIETVRKLVSFYVEQHNTHVPHYAFKGQTPDEVYFSTGTEVPEQLRIATLEARKLRRAANLQVSCSRCRTEQLVPNSTANNST